jgi:hypothetical protein
VGVILTASTIIVVGFETAPGGEMDLHLRTYAK